jgi:hypothetical protein
LSDLRLGTLEGRAVSPERVTDVTENVVVATSEESSEEEQLRDLMPIPAC